MARKSPLEITAVLPWTEWLTGSKLLTRTKLLAWTKLLSTAPLLTVLVRLAWLIIRRRRNRWRRLSLFAARGGDKKNDEKKNGRS